MNKYTKGGTVKNNKNFDTTFGLAVIIFLAAGLFVVNNMNNARIHEQSDNQIAMGISIQHKNARIRALTAELAAVKKELLGVKSDLDAVNKKLTAIVVPEAAPAAAAETAPVPAAK